MMLGKPIKPFEQEPKEERTRDTLRKFIPEMVEVNKAVKAGNFSAAYRIIDAMTVEASKSCYSASDRAFVHAKLIDVLMIQYGGEIRRLYETKIEQYRTQDQFEIDFSRQIDGYPRQTGQSWEDYREAYYRTKARKEINDETRKYRYGGYMHDVIDRVVNPEKYEQKEEAVIIERNGRKTIKVRPLATIPGVNDRDDRDDRDDR